MQTFGRDLLVSAGIAEDSRAFEAMIKTTVDELRTWLERHGHVIAKGPEITVVGDLAMFGARRITVEFQAEAGGWSEVDDEVLRHCGQWREHREPKHLWFWVPDGYEDHDDELDE